MFWLRLRYFSPFRGGGGSGVVFLIMGDLTEWFVLGFDFLEI